MAIHGNEWSNSGNTCNAGWQDYTTRRIEQNITVCNTLYITCSIRCLNVVSDCVWNQACSYSKRQIVFDFLGLTNQRPWFGICLLTLFRQLYTFKHVFIVNKQSNTLVNGFSSYYDMQIQCSSYYQRSNQCVYKFHSLCQVCSYWIKYTKLKGRFLYVEKQYSRGKPVGE